jgi:hypothetical protein
MKTYWSAQIMVGETCKVTVPNSDLALCLSGAITDAMYYMAIYPGEKISIRNVREYCVLCHNSGKIIRKSVRWIKCPECKGHIATGAVATIPVELPNPANRVVLSIVEAKSA